MEIGLIRQSKILFLKELRTEWRNRYAINGILVQLVASVFISYLCFSNISPITWNALFWVIILFTGVNAIARSFIQERAGKLLYLHSLVHPLAVLYSKMMINILVSLVVSCLGLVLFIFFLGKPGWDLTPFLGIVALFSIGIGSLFTTVSAIASKTKSGSVLMPLLSFPLIIPLLLVTITAASYIVAGFTENLFKSAAIIALLDVMIMILGSLLFRFLWQD